MFSAAQDARTRPGKNSRLRAAPCATGSAFKSIGEARRRQQLQVLGQAEEFSTLPTINSKEVYETFLSTRIVGNHELGEFEQDY